MTDAVAGSGGRPAPPSSRQGLGRLTEAASAGQAAYQSLHLPWAVLLYLFTVVIPLGLRVGPLVVTSLRALLLILIIPLFGKLLMGKLGKVLLTDVLFVLHVVWTVVALSVNSPSQVVTQTGSVGVEFLGGYLVGRAYIRTADTFAATCRALVLVVCCIMPFALMESLTFRPILVDIVRSTGVAAVVAVDEGTRMGMRRAQATFAHPILYGLFCSVAFSLAFVALTGVVSTTRRYLSAAAIAFAVFLSLSSGALLATVLQVALITWSTALSRVKSRWWVLVALFAMAYFAIDMLSNRSPLQVFMSYATFSAHNAYYRNVIFEWGMTNLWSSPIFGIGLKDWVRPGWMGSASVDNFWLLMAMRYGIPGFLLLALGYALGMMQVMRRDFHSNAQLTQFRRAWVFTFLGLSFTLCTVHIWTNVYSFVFFMFGAGMWMIRVPSDAGTTQPETFPDKPGARQPQPASSTRSSSPHTRFPAVPRGGASQPMLRTPR